MKFKKLNSRIYEFNSENPYVFAISGFTLIFIILSLSSPYFLKIDNLSVISRQFAINAVLAIGMTFVILTGGIDLSVGAIAALVGSVVAGLLKSGLPIGISLLVGLLLGVVIGVINGLVITKVKVPAIIATLAMMEIARGSGLLYTGGYPIAGLPESIRLISVGINPIIIVIFLYSLAAFVLSKLKSGHYLYAIGGNEESARYSGIKISKYILFAYIVSGLMASIAGILLISRTGSGQPSAAVGFELTAIAAVVIGGTSIEGGKGHVIGTLFGALTLALINNGLNLIGINPFAQQVVRGVIIIFAIYFNNITKKK